MKAETDRNADIVMRAIRGEHFSALAHEYGISRERVRQIVFAAGASGAAYEARAYNTLREQKRRAQEVRSTARFGMDTKTRKELVALGTTRRWAYLKRNCRSRCIPFDLSLKDYAAIVGKLPIGREKGQYVLVPRNAELGYVVGNLILRSASANARATRDRDTEAPRLARATGVYELYPGRPKPFAVRYCNKPLGCFSTVEEAIAARAAYIEQLTPTPA